MDIYELLESMMFDTGMFNSKVLAVILYLEIFWSLQNLFWWPREEKGVF